MGDYSSGRYVTTMENKVKKALAVDDSEPMRKLVSYVLRTAGFEVTIASDGAEALENFQQDNFDLVVTDMNMPRMGGLELIRQIRQNDTETPILALTSEFEPQIRKAGADAGANGWVVKPFNAKQFVDLVHQMV